MCARKSLKCATYIKLKRESILGSNLLEDTTAAGRVQVLYIRQPALASLSRTTDFHPWISRTNSYSGLEQFVDARNKSTVANSVSTDRLQGALLWLPVSKPQL